MENNFKFLTTKKCLVCNNEFESLIFRKQKCCDAKCSGVYVASQPDRIDKIKKTKLKKGNAKLKFAFISVGPIIYRNDINHASA